MTAVRMSLNQSVRLVPQILPVRPSKGLDGDGRTDEHTECNRKSTILVLKYII
jgi:hypothetical protein